MIARDLESFAALGSSLTKARTRGVISPAQFASAAKALALAMLTGTMEMEAYAGVHWVLGLLIEAAFTAPARKKPEELGPHIETVDRMWNYVGPSDAALGTVNRFFEKALDMEKAGFERPGRFFAPMKLRREDFARMLKTAGVTVISSGGPKEAEPGNAVLSSPENIPEGAPHLIVGWGERRMAFLFT